MTRQVSLSEEAYRTLSRMKGKDMSFSDVVMKLSSAVSQKRDFLRFAGSMESETKELEKLRKRVEQDRQRNMDTAD